MNFEEELSQLINKHSQENASNTPDFILAKYLCDCLNAWNNATWLREQWYGRGEASNSTAGTAQK